MYVSDVFFVSFPFSLSSIDATAMDLTVKPAPFIEGNRTTTIDALDLVLDDDPIIHPSEMRREESREERIADLQPGLLKPNTMTADNRLTTKDFMDIANELGMPAFESNGSFDSVEEMRTFIHNLEAFTLDTPRGRAGLMPRPLKDAEPTR